MAINQKLAELKAKQEQWEREFKQRLEEMRAEEEALVKAGEQAEKLIAAVKKINMDPALAYDILLEAGLITAPVIQAQTQSTAAPIAIITLPPAKEGGRSSTTTIRQGDDVSAYKARSKGAWAVIKAKGVDTFLQHLTPTGKDWIETDDGKAWLAKSFA